MKKGIVLIIMLLFSINLVFAQDELKSSGDTNADGKTDLADAVNILNYLFGGGILPSACNCEKVPSISLPPELEPLVSDGESSSGCSKKSGDTNGDGETDLADAVYLLNYLFGGGSEPVRCCLCPPSGLRVITGEEFNSIVNDENSKSVVTGNVITGFATSEDEEETGSTPPISSVDCSQDSEKPEILYIGDTDEGIIIPGGSEESGRDPNFDIAIPMMFRDNCALKEVNINGINYLKETNLDTGQAKYSDSSNIVEEEVTFECPEDSSLKGHTEEIYYITYSPFFAEKDIINMDGESWERSLITTIVILAKDCKDNLQRYYMEVEYNGAGEQPTSNIKIWDSSPVTGVRIGY
jgi:hypothetical protein